MKKLELITLSLFCTLTAIRAEITLPSVIGDNMVLQQKTASAIWGKADPGEMVSVEGNWEGAVAESIVTDSDGHWMVRIQTPPAGGPFVLTIAGNNTLELKNVMSGEVWLAGGQSNTKMPVQGFAANQPVKGSAVEIATANYPNIRLFDVNSEDGSGIDLSIPQFTCPGQWKECSPETVGSFSAIGYFFGKEIHQYTDVPVGIIHSSVGGTFLETWMRSEIVENDPEFSKIGIAVAEQKEAWFQEHPEDRSKPTSELPYHFQDFEQVGNLYNGIIAPLIPFTIKGVIWYQGESNGGRGKQYQTLFPAMIQNWRNDWGQGDFPFYFVQIANFYGKPPGAPSTYKKPDVPVAHIWAELREAQFMALAVTNTGMAVTIDIGEECNIHPANKIDVGKRLSLWALAKDYGKNVIYSGPLYKSMQIEGDKIRISFEHAESGLAAKGEILEGFAIAGADEQFFWADAVIDGDTVVVSNPTIKTPVAVRYAWEFNPTCNLYNGATLPASPFRTDQWKLQSEGVIFTNHLF